MTDKTHILVDKRQPKQSRQTIRAKKTDGQAVNVTISELEHDNTRLQIDAQGALHKYRNASNLI